MTQRLGVVLVNHHCEAGIAERVARFDDATFEVVVVDNSGTFPIDGAPLVVRPGRNVGFGAGCNLGVGALSPAASAVCLHNPDVDIDPSAVRRLAADLATNQRPGLVAPAVDDGAGRRVDGYRYPSTVREVALTARAVTAWRASSGMPETPATIPPATAAVTRRGGGRRFATAALLVVDRRAWDDVGGFDERYFLYAEDLDLWHRIAEKGWSVGFAPDVVARHERGTGSPAGRPWREVLRWLGVELFAETTGIARWRWMRLAHRAGLALQHRHAPALCDAVAERWRQGLAPSATLSSLRPLLESEVLSVGSAPIR